MSIITISRGSYSRGKEVAEKLAQILGYECISREVLLEASEQFNIPEIKLVRAIHDAPSILESFGSNKKKYIAFFQSALLKRIQRDNKVYHGLAGHFFLAGVSHVLKVRIIADLEDRVKLEMEREKISSKDALKLLKKDDEERRKWSLSLYGLDTNDPSLYDLVINVSHLTVADAADIIAHTAGFDRFRATEQSKRAMDDLVMASEIRAKLINWHPSVQVTVKNGEVEVRIERLHEDEAEIRNNVVRLTSNLPGVKRVKINVSRLDR